MKKNIFIIGLFLLSISVVIIFLNLNKSKEYQVTFDTVGGSAVPNLVVKSGETILRPEDPTKDGYLFKEWILDEQSYEFNNKIYSNLVLTAEWVKVEDDKEMYVVRFNTAGGNTIANEIIESGNVLTESIVPIKEGYVFEYWELDGKKYDFSNPINKNIELTAIWKVDANLDKIVIQTPTLTNVSGSIDKGKRNIDFSITAEGNY